MLARRGVQVAAWPMAEQVHEAGLAALLRAGGRQISAAPTTAPDLVLDGIVGIGGRPGLRPAAMAALKSLAGVPVIAVDTPSGVDVDTGRLDGDHVEAVATITFGTHKIAHLVDPASQAAGAVHLVDLGLDLPTPVLEALQTADVAALLPRPARSAHKYTRGVVGIRAGSARYPGAALLSVSGADVGLTGMVRFVGESAVADRVRTAHPAVVGAGRVQAWVVGSGGGDTAGRELAAALEDEVPTVVDADALAHLPALLAGLDASARARLVLTPHAGELSALLDVAREEIEADQLRHVTEAAATCGATVLLKGRHTLVATPGLPTRVTTTGTPWLATAGAGDVLGGLIGALLASGLPPHDAASVGSWVHGAAATRAGEGGPLTAAAIGPAVTEVLRSLLGPRSWRPDPAGMGQSIP